mmetsp:Transcript_2088/g.13468  ORF Transcript_2088/g.13468 Transcript_2088/m.13468 type:complete len:239 (-) Transcript_2088:2891-3607(-)
MHVRRATDAAAGRRWTHDAAMARRTASPWRCSTDPRAVRRKDGRRWRLPSCGSTAWTPTHDGWTTKVRVPWPWRPTDAHGRSSSCPPREKETRLLVRDPSGGACAGNGSRTTSCDVQSARFWLWETAPTSNTTTSASACTIDWSSSERTWRFRCAWETLKKKEDTWQPWKIGLTKHDARSWTTSAAEHRAGEKKRRDTASSCTKHAMQVNLKETRRNCCASRTKLAQPFAGWRRGLRG